MRIIVISDTHGNIKPIQSVFLKNKDADFFIHLGDGERELNDFLIAHPEYTERTIHVAGNCDYGSLSSGFEILPIGLTKIFITHGHLFSAKYGNDVLKRTAKQYECNVVLFGHTHERYNKFEDGIYFLNPGSASVPRDGQPPSFGNVDILDFGIVTNIADI